MNPHAYAMRLLHGPNADEFRRCQEEAAVKRAAQVPMGRRKQALMDARNECYHAGLRLGVYPREATHLPPPVWSEEQKAAIAAYEAALVEFQACPWEE